MSGFYALIRLRIISNLQAKQVRIERRRLRDCSNPFETVSEQQFQDQFRLKKYMVIDLLEDLSLDKRSRSHGLNESLRLLCALQFFATGSYQRSVGQNFYIAMSQTSVSRCVEEVSTALQRLGTEYIKFPPQSQFDNIKLEFYNVCGFPGIVGLVDGTHVKIMSPNNNIEHVYYCRKGGHSKNVQVCGSNLEIYGINARFGGTAHDSFVWRSSNIKEHLQSLYNNNKRDFWFLGDSGYPLQPWLMTPISNDHTESQKKYNVAHKKTRQIVERAIGVLKSRFRCLLHQRVLCYSPKKSGEIINACVILHNIMIRANIPINEDEIENEEDGEEEDNYDPNAHENNNTLQQAKIIQARIIENYFN